MPDEWCVMRPDLPDEPHRGPMSETDARRWVEQAKDRRMTDVWIVVVFPDTPDAYDPVEGVFSTETAASEFAATLPDEANADVQRWTVQ